MLYTPLGQTSLKAPKEPNPISTYSNGIEEPDIRFWKKPVLQWTSTWSHNAFQIEDPTFTAQTNQTVYFSSALAEPALEAGDRYYFEIIITGLLSSYTEVKVGMSQAKHQNLTKGFSSTTAGWGYYLRNQGGRRYGTNSGNEQMSYGGIRYEEGDVIGVYVDMVDGYLAFSSNGRYLGPWFSAEDGIFDIKQPLLAACSVYGNFYKVKLVREIEDRWERRRLALWCLTSDFESQKLEKHSKNLFREMINFL